MKANSLDVPSYSVPLCCTLHELVKHEQISWGMRLTLEPYTSLVLFLAIVVAVTTELTRNVLETFENQLIEHLSYFSFHGYRSALLLHYRSSLLHVLRHISLRGLARGRL